LAAKDGVTAHKQLYHARITQQIIRVGPTLNCIIRYSSLIITTQYNTLKTFVVPRDRITVINYAGTNKLS